MEVESGRMEHGRQSSGWGFGFKLDCWTLPEALWQKIESYIVHTTLDGGQGVEKYVLAI